MVTSLEPTLSSTNSNFKQDGKKLVVFLGFMFKKPTCSIYLASKNLIPSNLPAWQWGPLQSKYHYVVWFLVPSTCLILFLSVGRCFVTPSTVSFKLGHPISLGSCPQLAKHYFLLLKAASSIFYLYQPTNCATQARSLWSPTDNADLQRATCKP
jgi:hypothetical protein